MTCAMFPYSELTKDSSMSSPVTDKPFANPPNTLSESVFTVVPSTAAARVAAAGRANRYLLLSVSVTPQLNLLS